MSQAFFSAADMYASLGRMPMASSMYVSGSRRSIYPNYKQLVDCKYNTLFRVNPSHQVLAACGSASCLQLLLRRRCSILESLTVSATLHLLLCFPLIRDLCRFAQEILPSVRLLALMSCAECHLMTSDFAASSVYLLQSICCLALRLVDPFRMAVENLNGIPHMMPISALMRSLEAACNIQDWLLAEELIEKMLLDGTCCDAIHRALHSIKASL
jgi:hypothetical protein